MSTARIMFGFWSLCGGRRHEVRKGCRRHVKVEMFISWFEARHGLATAAAPQSVHVLEKEADSVLQALQVFSWLVSCRGLSNTVHILNKWMRCRRMARSCCMSPRSVLGGGCRVVFFLLAARTCLASKRPRLACLLSCSRLFWAQRRVQFCFLSQRRQNPQAWRASRLETTVQEEELSVLTNSVCLVRRERKLCKVGLCHTVRILRRPTVLPVLVPRHTAVFAQRKFPGNRDDLHNMDLVVLSRFFRFLN